MTSVECCQPRQMWAPSGLQWRHQNDCPVDPNGFVRYVNESKQNVDPLPRRHRLENARRGHQEPRKAHLRADEPHSACRAAFNDGGVICSRCSPLLHEEGCGCWPCEANDFNSLYI